MAEKNNYLERANLNFDILHKHFDAILSKISKFYIERAILRMFKFCIIRSIKLSNVIILLSLLLLLKCMRNIFVSNIAIY